METDAPQSVVDVAEGLDVSALLDINHPLKQEVADWASDHLDAADLVQRDAASSFDRTQWDRVAATGLLGSAVSRDYGGTGDDLVTTTLKLEGLGYGCRDNGLATAVAAQMLIVQHVLSSFGTEAQRRSLLPRMVSGELIGAFAATEQDAGSDTFSMATRAEADEDGYRLSGRKSYVTLGPIADVAVVFASTNPDVGRWGVSAFLVRAGRPGVTFTTSRDKMGLRTSPLGDIELDGYLAGADDLIGQPGSGASIFSATMEPERGLMFATQLGAAHRIIDESVTASKTREQYGQPIGTFQAVSHRIAEMRVMFESARLQTYRTAMLLASGRSVTLEAAMTKLVVSEAVAAIALDAARVFGAVGYLSEYGIEREVRDALGGLVYSGTSDIQRNVIAALMEIPQ